MSNKLTHRQQKFVQEYLVDLNATQAAIRAGYSKRTACSIGYENLRKPEIKSAIDTRRDAILDEIHENQLRTVRQLSNCVHADIRDLFDEDGRLIPITELPPHVAAAIQSFEIVRRKSHEKNDEGKPVYHEVLKVRLVDKKNTLELMMRYQGMLKEDNKVDVRIGLGEEIRKARKRAGIIR